MRSKLKDLEPLQQQVHELEQELEMERTINDTTEHTEAAAAEVAAVEAKAAKAQLLEAKAGALLATQNKVGGTVD